MSFFFFFFPRSDFALERIIVAAVVGCFFSSRRGKAYGRRRCAFGRERQERKKREEREREERRESFLFGQKNKKTKKQKNKKTKNAFTCLSLFTLSFLFTRTCPCIAGRILSAHHGRRTGRVFGGQGRREKREREAMIDYENSRRSDQANAF